ncbi:hypothetical protein NDR96_09800 [Stenotrophomonas maltophilia]|nr:hypothetical protein NDR96_09800 [Stenotrophomonas maltophilia]
MRGRQLLVTVALVLAALLVLGIAVWWMLFKDTASTRRPLVQPPMLALPPPSAAATAAGKATGAGDAAGRDHSRAGAAGSTDAGGRADADPGQRRPGDDECRCAGRW